MAVALTVDPHPLLYLRAFTTALPSGLLDRPTPEWLCALVDLRAETPVGHDEAVRPIVRDLLRHGGFKPSGRSKPASEYLVRAVRDGSLRSINAVVDACNVVSLHSGIPISLVDLDRAIAPFHVKVAEPDTHYVFNPAGQVIDISGLLCLYDAEGPCANAVKDAQRTKTNDKTRRTLSVIWGPTSLGERVDTMTAWYREIIEKLGGATEKVS